jgi:hypothetical protein
MEQKKQELASWLSYLTRRAIPCMVKGYGYLTTIT